jgi:hypothetical protein
MAKKKDSRRYYRKALKKQTAAGKKRPITRLTSAASGGTSTGTPPTTAAQIADVNRKQRAIRRAIDTQREKTFREYRSHVAQVEKQDAAPLKRVFAEGDSWFNYPLGSDVIDQLQDLIHTPIANFAWPGAETRQLLALKERKEIEKRFRDGPEKGKKWDVLLFSGGGDDIVGDQMVLFLTPGTYDPQYPAAVLNARFDEILDLVMGAYRDLIALRDSLSPQTLIVTHVYDYAWATNKGVCWVGPWLRPSLDYAHVPQGVDQHKVMTAMLDRFDTELQKVKAATTNFLIVPTHDTLKKENEWANELHPKDPGFGLIAHKFQAVLQQHLGAEI